MKCKELVDWIKENHAEELEVYCEYDPWCGNLGEPRPEIRKKTSYDSQSMPDEYVRLC